MVCVSMSIALSAKNKTDLLMDQSRSRHRMMKNLFPGKDATTWCSDGFSIPSRFSLLIA